MTFSSEIQKLLERPATWLASRPQPGTIAVSCRIRLARNLAGYPFPLNAPPAVRREILSRFLDRLDCLETGKDWMRIDMESLDDTAVALLFERKLISREFRNRTSGRVLAVAPDSHLSVMINEEDHFRMQFCCPGECLKKAWRHLFSFDRAVEEALPCAWLPGRGYATSCPTNLGTAMRASVMLHLPALTMSDGIKTVLHSLPSLGLTARGLYGEGGQIVGNLYQISNQSTLGESEDEILDRLERVVSLTVKQEEAVRREFISQRPSHLMDMCARAYGVLKYSYRMGSNDALNLLSLLRLGVDLGLFPSVRLYDVNRMMLLVQPAHLCRLAGRSLGPEDRAVRRAGLLRGVFGGPPASKEKE